MRNNRNKVGQYGTKAEDGPNNAGGKRRHKYCIYTHTAINTTQYTRIQNKQTYTYHTYHPYVRTHIRIQHIHAHEHKHSNVHMYTYVPTYTLYTRTHIQSDVHTCIHICAHVTYRASPFASASVGCFSLEGVKRTGNSCFNRTGCAEHGHMLSSTGLATLSLTAAGASCRKQREKRKRERDRERERQKQAKI